MPLPLEDAPTSSNYITPHTYRRSPETSLALDSLSPRLANLKPSSLYPRRPNSPTQEDDALYPTKEVTNMAGPARRSRRSVKEDTQPPPPLETGRKRNAPKRRRPIQTEHASHASDSDNTIVDTDSPKPPPRKSRNLKHSAQSKEHLPEQTDEVSYPDLTLFTRRRFSNRGTQDDPITLHSDPDLDKDEGNDTQFARRLRRVGYDATTLSDYHRIQQQKSDAAMAQKLHKEDEEERKKHQELRMQIQDCTVCGEPILLKDFPSLADCTHEPDVCPDCYAGWIATEIVDGSWREVKCPASECKVILKHHEIHQLAKAESFER